MAELLVRVVDKINDDPYLNAQCTKRGDVIVVMPDGWGWGKQELTNPEWRIVKLPGVSVSEASTFLGPEFDTDPLNPSRMLQRRAFRLDVDALPDPKGQMADHKRKNPLHKVNLTGGQLIALKHKKPALADPNVLD